MARDHNLRAASAALTTAFGLLAGCSMLHENVKGGFLCQAPKGVCAPSTSIDDAALAQMSGQLGDGDMAPASDIVPASDMAMAGQDPIKSSRHAGYGEAARAVATNGRPALRVVHPAWRDAQGRLHARTTDYTYVDASPVQAADASKPETVADPGDGTDRSLLGVAERAPQIGGITLAASSPSPLMATMTPPALPVANPNEAIAAKVAAILARAPKPVGSRVPAPTVPVISSEPASANQSGATFPPAGS